MRQRLRAHTSPLAYLGHLLVAVLAGALVWYGLMVMLLAFKVSPHSVNDISAYRSVYDYFAGLGVNDISTRVRLIAGLSGLGTFLLAAYLAWKEVPRPYLARTGVALYEDEVTTVTVGPRAIERAAELAASEHEGVSAAAARYAGEDGLTVDVSVKHARGVPSIVREVHNSISAALARHELPAMPVNVTLAGFDRKHRRELN